MPPTHPRNPTPLLVAAGLAAVQGAALVVLAVLEVTHVSSERMSLGVTTSIFFAVYGALLLGCAWALTREQTWARGPVLLTQLIELGLAWNLRDHPLVALPLAVVAGAVIAGIVHPASRAALDDDPTGSRRED